MGYFTKGRETLFYKNVQRTNVTRRYNIELLHICHRTVELTTYIFSFSENARRVSSLFRDRPITPADSVVYWTKYLIRHGAEANIRPLSADASWTSYFMMDMCAALVVTIFVLWCCARAVRVTLGKFKHSSKNPEPCRWCIMYVKYVGNIGIYGCARAIHDLQPCWLRFNLTQPNYKQ